MKYFAFEVECLIHTVNTPFVSKPMVVIACDAETASRLAVSFVKDGRRDNYAVYAYSVKNLGPVVAIQGVNP